jgi:hypothetical protein
MGEPNVIVPIALLAFVLLTAACFQLFEPQRAVLYLMLGGWLFLPHFDERFRALILTSKAAFVPAVVLLGSIIFDARWRRFRPRLFDLPMAVLCVGPFVTALSNDLGTKEAASAMLDATMTWGAPYFLGRLYLGDGRALKEFATALAVAALVYVPFCLWEDRMSPQLHYTVYGFRAENFTTMIRFGGFRPSVFMQTGLAVAFFMAMGTLSAIWLWRTGARRELAGVPLNWLCIPLLLLTTIVCRSTGAIILLAVGIAVLEGTRFLRTPALIIALAVLPSAYCAARISGWDADTVVAVARDVVNEERASSLQFRFENEHLLIKRAQIRPWLGWGRFGRSFVYDEDGQRVTIVDSMWIIAFGVAGLVGLLALGAMLAIPPVALSRALPIRYWANPRIAPAAALAVTLLLWALDNLVNAMMTPVFAAIMGALVSFVLALRGARVRGAKTFKPVSSRLAVEPSFPM